jgi:hypothetical protein
VTGDVLLGEFRRDPADFGVYRTGPDAYRVDCRDSPNGGPSEVCRFTADTDPVWRGAWNGDEWCLWILAETQAIIKRPK